MVPVAAGAEPALIALVVSAASASEPASGAATVEPAMPGCGPSGTTESSRHARGVDRDTHAQHTDADAAILQVAPPSLESALRRAMTGSAASDEQLPQPRIVGVAAQLPRTQTGKLDRRAVTQLCVALLHRACLAPSAAAPSTDVPPAESPSATTPAQAAGTDNAHASAHDVASLRVQEHHTHPVSEAVVMRACVDVLQPLLAELGRPLEPTDSLLTLGASSLHVAAIAAILNTQPAQVYASSTCRSLARALQTDPRTCAGFVARQATSSNEEPVPRLRSPAASSCVIAATASPPEQAAKKRKLRTLAPEDINAPKSPLRPALASCGSSTVALNVHDSRGEAHAAHVTAADLPSVQPYTQGDTPPRRGDQTLAQMRACVDAPLAILEYTCGGKPSCSCAPQSYVLACSHAGDVACIGVEHEARAWTAQLPSSPDAGGQVSACGHAVAVAVLDGRVCLLRLSDGAWMCTVDTGGQLRRCVFELWCLVSAASGRSCARQAQVGSKVDMGAACTISTASEWSSLCRAPVLDPWLGLLWTYGHGQVLHGWACARHFAAAAETMKASSAGARPDASLPDECVLQLRQAGQYRLVESSSALVRFCNAEDVRCEAQTGYT